MVPEQRSLLFALNDNSDQSVIAALLEKDEEDHGEESISLTLARCHENSEKIKKIIKQ